MTDTPLPSDPTPTEEQLVRLADGSLPAADHDALTARVGESAELQARLREQQRAVSLLRATEDVVAPARLRTAVSELTPAPRRDGRRARPVRPLFGAGALVAAAVIAAVLLVTAGHTAPSVRGTARLALAASTAPAPATDVRDPSRLTVQAGSIPFPSYVGTYYGWRASGARRDTLAGRRVTTVFYRSDDARVGYSVVSGAALAIPSGRAVTRGGVRYVLGHVNGVRLVTWRRGGHTCVIAGPTVSSRTLLALAVADETTV